MIPYFGSLDPDHMKLWFKACKYNKDFDFILLSDDDKLAGINKPENVILVMMSWATCVQKIQSFYDFKIPLVYKYKLCDLKPAYGEIFREYLEGYEFWGHMDISDTIFGNLRNYITDDLLDFYDKIHMYGHFTLYRNTVENNGRYRIPLLSGKSYMDAFSVEETICFDEMYNEISINKIYMENGYKKIDDIQGLVIDILPFRWSFWLAQDNGKKIPRILEWDKGILKEVTLRGGNIVKREIGYVHFQKRRIANYLTVDTDHFFLIPNCVIPADLVTVTAEWLSKISKDRIYLSPMIGRIKRIINYGKHPKVFLRKLRSQQKRRK